MNNKNKNNKLKTETEWPNFLLCYEMQQAQDGSWMLVQACLSCSLHKLVPEGFTWMDWLQDCSRGQVPWAFFHLVSGTWSITQCIQVDKKLTINYYF